PRSRSQSSIRRNAPSGSWSSRVSDESVPRIAQLPVAAHERVRRRVVHELVLPARAELRRDLGGELLAELDSPLIEGIDLPDRRLREDAVLLEGDERAEGERRQYPVGASGS